MPHSCPSPCQEPPWFWRFSSQKCFLNHFMACPSSPRNTCFTYLVCLFQVSHLFLQFHPLGLWGCFVLKPLFQDSSSFPLSPKASDCAWTATCHLYTLSVCNQFPPLPSSDERLEHLWREPLVVLTQARPGHRGVMPSKLSTLNWQWLSALPFKFQISLEVFCKWSHNQIVKTLVKWYKLGV